MKRSLRILCGIVFFFCLVHVNAQAVNTGKARPKTALVLSGGGAWGLSHIGAIKIIEEIGIPIDIVVGTSMGSIIGGLYAAGYSADELVSIVEPADWADLFNEKARNEYQHYLTLEDNARYFAHVNFDKSGFFLPGGLLTGEKILRYLDTYFLNIPSPVNFDDLPRIFRAVATDINTGEPVVISNGSVPDAIRASMSIPGVFTPWLIEEVYCIDGGVVDNLPINLAREMGAEIVIAVDLLDTQSFKPDNVKREPFSALQRTVDIFIRTTVEKQLPNADLVITVDMQGITIMEFDKSKELYALGLAAALEKKEALEEIKLAHFTDDEDEIKGPQFPETKPPLHILGASAGDYKRITELYDREDFNSDSGTVGLLFEAVDRTGRYNSMRIHRDSLSEGSPLIISLSPKALEDNAVRLSFIFQTTLSRHNSMGFNLSPGLVLNGLSTRTSRLTVNAEVFNTPGFEISYLQPLNDYFSLKPFITMQQISDVRFSEAYMGDNVNYLNTGLDFTAFPFNGTMMGLGWNFDHINTKFDNSENIDNNHLFHAYFSYLRIDSPVFPMQGGAAFLDYKFSFYRFDSSGFFQVLKTEGFTAISLGTPFSVALRWKGGTDLSFTKSNRAPVFDLPSLSSRWHFPSSLSITEETGSHVLGLGLEVKYRINWIILPFYALLQWAGAGVIQETEDISWDSVFHWNASLGIGVKINDAFGIAFRGGVHQGIDKRFSPYFALDVGALGFF
jgi:NTE family protein